MIHWAPKPDQRTVLLGSIWTVSKDPIPWQEYLDQLSSRLQNLVNRSEDPETATQFAESSLQEAGLWDGEATLQADSSMHTLVGSNPKVWERLSELGISPMTVSKQVPKDLLSAMQQLNSETKDPDQSLEAWLTALET